MNDLTIEQIVDRYFKEIEDVFKMNDAAKLLTRYGYFVESGDSESAKAYEGTMLGGQHKEYWVKFTVNEPNLLNSFLMNWVVGGKSIAGVKGEVLSWSGVGDTREIKEKLHKFIDEL